MLLTENKIKEIIKESLLNLICEVGLSKEQLGSSGSFVGKPTSSLDVKTLRLMFDQYTEADERPYRTYLTMKQKWENQHRGENYNDFLRKKGREAPEMKTPIWWQLFYDRLSTTGFHGIPMYYDSIDGTCIEDGKEINYTSYIVGFKIGELFIATYIAPYKNYYLSLLTKLASYNNILFAITDDMASTLRAMGLYEADKKIPMDYQLRTVLKNVFATSPVALARGMVLLPLMNKRDKSGIANEINNNPLFKMSLDSPSADINSEDNNTENDAITNNQEAEDDFNLQNEIMKRPYLWSLGRKYPNALIKIKNNPNLLGKNPKEIFKQDISQIEALLSNLENS